MDLYETSSQCESSRGESAYLKSTKQMKDAGVVR